MTPFRGGCFRSSKRATTGCSAGLIDPGSLFCILPARHSGAPDQHPRPGQVPGLPRQTPSKLGAFAARRRHYRRQTSPNGLGAASGPRSAATPQAPHPEPATPRKLPQMKNFSPAQPRSVFHPTIAGAGLSLARSKGRLAKHGIWRRLPSHAPSIHPARRGSCPGRSTLVLSHAPLRGLADAWRHSWPRCFYGTAPLQLTAI